MTTWEDENKNELTDKEIKLNDELVTDDTLNRFMGEYSGSEPQDTEEDNNDGGNPPPERVPRGSKPPKLDLKEAVEILTKIYEDAGGLLSMDVLSKFTENSQASSTFKNKLSALKKFKLIEDEDGELALTETARLIVAPKTPEEKQANLKTAFLGYDKFENIYSQFAGKILPQDEFLKNYFAEIVPKKLAKKWMENFKISAEFAGLFSKRTDGRIQILEGVGEIVEEKEIEDVIENPELDSVTPPEDDPEQNNLEKRQNTETETGTAIRKIFLKESEKSIWVSTDASMFEIKTGKDMNFVLKLIELFDEYENGEKAKPIPNQPSIRDE